MPRRLDLECKKRSVSVQYKDRVTATSLHIVFYCLASLSLSLSLSASLHTFSLSLSLSLYLSLFFSLCHVPLLSNCSCPFVFLGNFGSFQAEPGTGAPEKFFFTRKARNRRGHLGFMKSPNTTKRGFFSAVPVMLTLENTGERSTPAKPGFAKS